MIMQGDVKFKDFPPIRNKSNLNFLWDWLKLAYVDAIGAHHASISPLYKSIDNGDFKKNLSGINCLGFTL